MTFGNRSSPTKGGSLSREKLGRVHESFSWGRGVIGGNAFKKKLAGTLDEGGGKSLSERETAGIYSQPHVKGKLRKEEHREKEELREDQLRRRGNVKAKKSI